MSTEKLKETQRCHGKLHNTATKLPKAELATLTIEPDHLQPDDSLQLL